MANRRYSIGDVSRISGVSARALRLYEQAGLLEPARLENGYRSYSEADINRLQEILLLRRAGVAVADILPLLSGSAHERESFLKCHLEQLKQERRELDRLINTVEKTLEFQMKGTPMTDEEKFEGMKRSLVDENERAYGAEVRERYGDATIEESNRKMLGLTQGQFARFRDLDSQIVEELERAVCDGVDPLGEAGERMYEMHREWLGFTWGFYTPEAHCGLSEGYVADDRFRAYYDRNVEGCAEWLRDAICAHAHK